jgi:hypothetical protein
MSSCYVYEAAWYHSGPMNSSLMYTHHGSISSCHVDLSTESSGNQAVKDTPFGTIATVICRMLLNIPPH